MPPARRGSSPTVVLAALAALAVVACGRDAAPRKAPLPPDEATEVLAQRIWLDKEPAGWSDPFHVLVFDPSGTGVYQERTVWKGTFELFLYEAEAGRLDLRLPATRKVVKTGFTIEPERRGEADVKLTLERVPAGPRVYRGYRVPGGDVETWLKARFAGE